ncbi:RNA polymerase sigma-70 factor [Botryobacter ruber]|uniref:RNA polymerase sigma-70 factor n=1 Tax=Botryobacter ruber TaxID=2171629 RepID=UPI000E0C09CB|nr:RNA polymerase sigma-70 factor [Botryobacter ruber]
MEMIKDLLSVEKEVCITTSDAVASDLSVGEQNAALPDNELLIRKAFETDPKQGCELLFQYYYKGLCSHAARFVYSRTIAEDIVSDVFCQFYLKGTFHEITTSYRAFLYKSVRNRAYNYLKLEATRSVELDAAYESTATSFAQQPDAVVEYDELCQQVEAAINALPAQCRKIYLMHRFEDKKYAEIAEELQLSPRTVEVQIRKGSQHVREFLSRHWLFLVLFLCGLC